MLPLGINPLDVYLTGASTVLLAVVLYRVGALTADGLISALVVGVVVGVFGGYPFFLLLLLFLLVGFGATKYRFREKERLGVQEGKRGERGWKNVWATGAVATFVPVVYRLFPEIFPENTVGAIYVVSISVAASDTIASEMGMLFGTPVLITSPRKRVPIGTNGGVTAMGTLWSLLAAILMGISGFLLSVFMWFPSPRVLADFFGTAGVFLIAGLFGFLGCLFDSILGALFENRKKMTKHQVNFVSTLLATVIAWEVFFLAA